MPGSSVDMISLKDAEHADLSNGHDQEHGKVADVGGDPVESGGDSCHELQLLGVADPFSQRERDKHHALDDEGEGDIRSSHEVIKDVTLG